jgi:outer membrane protein TolC
MNPRNWLGPRLILCALLSAAGAVAQDEPEVVGAPEPSTEPVPKSTDFETKIRSMLARPNGMTAAAAARMAERSSLDVRVKRAELSAARAELDQAVVAYAPRLSLTARYVRLSPIDAQGFGPDGANLVATPAAAGPLPPGAPLVAVPGSALSFPVILDQYTLQAGLVVPVSDYLIRIPETRAASARQSQSASVDVVVAKRAAHANGKLLYYEWVRAKLSQVAADQSVAQAKSHLAVVEALQGAERASKGDVLLVQAQLARAELVETRANTVARLSEDRLRTALHDTSNKPYAIGEDLYAKLPPPPSKDTPALVAESLKRRPELTVLERTSAALSARAKATRSAGYPRLDAFGNVYYANPNQRYVPQSSEWNATWDVGLQLTWTPNDLASASAGAEALRARRTAVIAQAARLRDAIRTEVIGAHGAVTEATKAVETAARGLTAAEESYRVHAELFRFGRATTVQLTDAETELLSARLSSVNARVDLHAARVRLDHALGR